MSLLCEFEPLMPAFSEEREGSRSILLEKKFRNHPYSCKDPSGDSSPRQPPLNIKPSHRISWNEERQREFNSLLHRGGEEELRDFLSMHSENINIDVYDSEGKTPFHSAVLSGSLPVVKLLLAYGANERVTTRDGFSPLHLASYNGHSEVLNYLLSIPSRCSS
uniref:Notch-regulated ankyrin repeat-containing protein B n=1 Tax=Caligus rogercresseyi TaxID=217165 RepID=C1BPI0_CALRO|nr:Notch-regulated ankyrin repeat-containing protein B [Caligus rogercresseyi]